MALKVYRYRCPACRKEFPRASTATSIKSFCSTKGKNVRLTRVK